MSLCSKMSSYSHSLIDVFIEASIAPERGGEGRRGREGRRRECREEEEGRRIRKGGVKSKEDVGCR